MSSLEDRFWAKVDKRGPNDCWVWTAATNEHGYGVIYPGGRRSGPTLKAHRVACSLAGFDPAGQVVRHSCDNPPCVNPAHLHLGTQAENIADMHERGRGNVGTVNGHARLTNDQVLEIRRLYAGGQSQRRIGEAFGVHQVTISHIITGKTWRHVA